MAISYPTGLDTTTQPSAGNVVDSARIAKIIQMVEALEAKVGITGSAVSTSLDKRIAVLEATPAVAAGSGQLLATGMGNMQRMNIATTDRPAAGSMIMVGFIAPKSFTAANVNVYPTSGGSGVTLLKVGLYTIDASGNGTRVAVTADQSADVASTGKRTYAFTGTVAITAGQMYYTAVLGVGGTTRPSYSAVTTGGSSAIATGSLPYASSAIGSQTDIPASFLVGSVGATATGHYVEVTT